MNVNLVPSSESSKLTKVSSEAELSTKESDAHDGFFAKLMSLVTGEQEEAKTNSKHGLDSNLETEPSKVDGAADGVNQSEGDQVDKVSTQNSGDAELISSQLTSSTLPDDEPDPNKSTGSNESVATSEVSEAEQDVEKILAKGGELLERLGEANRTLQKGGKDLPLEQEEQGQKAELEPMPSSNDVALKKQVIDPIADDASDSVKSDDKIRQQELTDDPDSDSMADAKETEHQIVWGASDERPLSNKDAQNIKDTPSGKIAAPTPLANSVSQALNSPSLPADKANQQPVAVNAELNAAQLTSPSNGKVDVALEGEALKAALSKSMAANLGKNAQTEKLVTATLGQDDNSFANQLAHAAGHHGQSNALNPLMRSEQAAAPQQALTLHRDMASEQLAERVQVMLSKNLKNIDIRLDPPELGRLHIRMNMNGDTASVQFTVSNPQARDMIEHSMPRLREMLTQQGLQLSDTSVQQQSAGQQQSSYAQQGNESHSDELATNAAHGDENLDANVKVDVNVATKRDGISYYA